MNWLMAIPVWSTPRDSLNRFNLVFSRCPYEESPFGSLFLRGVGLIAATAAAAAAVRAGIAAAADRKSTRLNSSHMSESRMPSSA